MAVLGLVVSSSAQASAVQGAAAIRLLNQQRAANGIGPVSDNQRMASAWCPNEDHGPSGGESDRDLSPTPEWTRTESPWTDAPLHQQDLYDPLYTQAGEVNVGGQACFGPGAPASLSSPSFAAFTSEAGPSATPYSEIIPGESPYAPNQAVGLRLGAPTGPNLILYAEGFPAEREPGAGMQLTAWTLRTSSGKVVPHVRKLDYGVAAQYGYQGSVGSDTAILIPPVLGPRTHYVGTAQWTGPQGQTGTQNFSFTTVPKPGRVKVLTHGTVSLRHGAIRVRMSCTGGGDCPGEAVLEAFGGYNLDQQSLTLRAGRATTVTFHVSRSFLARIHPSPLQAEAGFVEGTSPAPGDPVSRGALLIRY